MAAPQPLIVDVGAVLDRADWNRFQRFVLALAALAFAMDGIANQSLGLAVPALMQDWHVARSAFGSVTAAGFVGLTIGAAGGGILGDRLGRRGLLIGSVLLFGLMTLAASAANGMSMLFWVRLLAGLGVGGAIPNGAALISEFTPLRHRPLALAIGMVFIAVGGMVAGLVGAFVLPVTGWRGLFVALGALPIVLALVFLFALPESPTFLARLPGRRSELFKVMDRCGHALDPDCTIADGRVAIGRTPLRTLFEGSTGAATLALWSAFFFCMLASYTMFSWVPVMLGSLGFKLALTSLGITAFSCGGIIGGVASGWLIERIGLKKAGLCFAMGGVIGAVLLGAISYVSAKNVTFLMGALVFEGFFVSGLLNVLYTLSAFMYPGFARATGVGAAAAAGRIGAIISSYTGVIALQMGGALGYFLVIAGSIAISFVSLALMREQPNQGNAANHVAPPAPARN